MIRQWGLVVVETISRRSCWRRRSVITTSICLWLTIAAPALQADPEWLASGREAMVACDSAQASAVGVQILRAGGNAFDAATAVSFALAVTRPYSTGVGGGGFLIARFADGRITCADFRETAPGAAGPDMYTGPPVGGNPKPSVIGYRAVGVPGLVAGRCEMQQRFGTLPLKKVLEPAMRLAQEGYAVDQHYVEATREVLGTYNRLPWLKERAAYVYRTHLNQGDLRKPGDRIKQPELGRFLEQLAAQGADFFYRGAFAEALVAKMQAHGGLITRQDLATYAVKWRRPLHGRYREFEVISMPPPSSGGIALIETLNILETLPLPALYEQDAVLADHYMVEAMKHAFADRARWLGDADFCKVPVELLTSKEYGRHLGQRLQATQVGSLLDYGTAQLPDDDGTSHFCIADRFGNTLVSTETINTAFGALVAVDEWGVVLNNEMDDFAARPGVPNAYGLIQSACNAVQAHKRPLSSMSPTIVLAEDQPVLLLGASGGPMIISSVLHVMLNILDFAMGAADAMAAVRSHHQWQPDEVFFDRPPPQKLREGLTAKGHTCSSRRRTGIVQLIQKKGQIWIGASDPRKGGRPQGY